MKKISVLLLGAITIFTSCQKEVSPSDTREDDSKKYLSKFISQEVASPGEATVLMFEYDAQKRCTKMKLQAVDTVGGMAQVSGELPYNFFYNGADEKPFKVSAGTATTYYMYDSQGRLLKDSTIDGGDVEVTNFTYASGRIYAYGYYIMPANAPVYKDTAEFTGDNVSRHSWEHALVPGVPALWWEDKFTYDDKPNPFYQLNIGSSFFASTRREFGAFRGLSKNNFVSNYQNDLVNWSPFDWTAQYTYKYDADDYPVSAQYTDGLGPTIAGSLRYEYLP